MLTIARDGARVTYRECYWGSRVIEMLPLTNGNFQLVSGNNSFRDRAQFTFESDAAEEGAAGQVTTMRRVGTDYVMPRLDSGTILPLEHIENGDVDRAIAGWDQQPDLDLGLMRFTSQRFDLDLEDQLEPGMMIRAYVARRFPLDQEAQEMLAEACAVAGEDARAQTIRRQYEALAEALVTVSSQFEAGQVDAGLAAFDRLAADISPDAYRWLFERAQELLADSPAKATLVAKRAVEHLPGSATAQTTLAHALWGGGDASGAIEMMNRAVATSPAIEQAVIERMWIRDRWKNDAVTMKADQMSQYVGDYGQRHIVVNDHKLSYYRGSNPPRELVPVGDHQFMMRDLDNFRLELVMDAKGRPDRIVGHYSSGRRDESPRDPVGVE